MLLWHLNRTIISSQDDSASHGCLAYVDIIWMALCTHIFIYYIPNKVIVGAKVHYSNNFTPGESPALQKCTINTAAM